MGVPTGSLSTLLSFSGWPRKRSGEGPSSRRHGRLRPGSVRVGELQIALLGGCGGGALAKKKWDFLSMYRRFFVQIGRSTHRWLRFTQTKQNQHNYQVTYVTGYRSCEKLAKDRYSLASSDFCCSLLRTLGAARYAASCAGPPSRKQDELQATAGCGAASPPRRKE